MPARNLGIPPRRRARSPITPLQLAYVVLGLLIGSCAIWTVFLLWKILDALI